MQVGQVRHALVELEAVPDEELVRDREADIAHREVVDEPAIRTVEERRECSDGLAQRQRARGSASSARVDHRVDEQDVPARDLAVEVLQEADPRRLSVP